jgi:hypothetical protein
LVVKARLSTETRKKEQKKIGRLYSSSFGISDDYGHPELKVDLDGISVDEFQQPAGKHHLFFNQPADHHLLPGSQHQPATAAAPGGYSLFFLHLKGTVS